MTMNESESREPMQPLPTEQETPQSPLGRDPVPEDPSPENVAPEPAETSSDENDEQSAESPTPDNEIPKLSKEDYEVLKSKSEVLDLIENEPELASYIEEYFQKKTTGNMNDTEPKEEESKNLQYVTKDEFQKLINMNKQLVASLEAEKFLRTHPEVTPEIQEEIGKVINKHPSFTLDEALEYVQRTKVPMEQTTQQRPTVKQSETETRPLQTSKVELDDLRSRINKTKDTKEAAALAWNYALAQEQAKEG